MKIIITGGAGFIASHVADAYINAGHNVVIIDNPPAGRRNNANKKAKYYKADIGDLAAIEKIFKKEKPEIVNHHAAIAEVIRSLRDPIPTLQTNVIGTANLLAAFGQYGQGKNKKFIFASTGGAMYGAPKKIPASEQELPITLSPYGLSKLMGEEAIKFYARHYGFDYFIFRYANIYGPRQNPHGEAGIVAIFSKLMKSGERPTIFGDGTKTRDYVFVGDIARANLIALKRGKNDTVNLGRGKLISDQMIFDTLAREIGFKEKVKYAPYRKGELYKSALDARKAKKVLGWEAKIALPEGIKKTLQTQ